MFKNKYYTMLLSPMPPKQTNKTKQTKTNDEKQTIIVKPRTDLVS